MLIVQKYALNSYLCIFDFAGNEELLTDMYKSFKQLL